MTWIDNLVDKIIQINPTKEFFTIRDEKTLSGRVHVGSLRGVVIHGIIAQVLEERGKKVKFIYEFNDFDPMDDLSQDLKDQGYDVHLYKPLYKVPATDDKFINFPEQWGNEFQKVINELGFHPEFPRAKDLYVSQTMDNWIYLCLTYPEKIRDVYLKVSGSQKDQNWTPVQLICPNCERIGTSIIRNFKCTGYVTYECKSCNSFGKCLPYNGNAKLAWKVEWPAKWDVYNVDIEGGGKDHCSSGGSRDIGETICKEITRTQIPFNIPYEFFLVGGKKMSSSKGIGQSAREIADLLPPEILRYLMLKSPPNKPIDFDPEGDTIPKLFDQYDQEEKNHTRLWELTQIKV